MKSTLHGYSINKHFWNINAKWWFTNINFESKHGSLIKLINFRGRGSSNLFDSLFLSKPIKPLIGISI